MFILSQTLIYLFILSQTLIQVLGDMSTSLFQIPLGPALFVFTIFTFTIFLAAFNLQGYHTDAAPFFMVILFCCIRYMEAHVLTSSYRAVATRFDSTMREPASSAVGMTDQVMTTVGSVLSTVMVSVVINCADADDDGR